MIDVPYLRKEGATHCGCDALVLLLLASGVNMHECSAPADLQAALIEPGCAAWAHFVELSEESAEVVADRMRRHWDKLPIVVATIEGLLWEFLATLRRGDANCLVSIVGYDYPAKQIVSGVALRLVGEWISAVRQHVAVGSESLDQRKQMALDELFEERPYREGGGYREATVARSVQNTLTRVLARRGMKTPAQIRKSHFAILFHTSVTRFGMSVADAVALCGAKDMRAAIEKVCVVLCVPTLEHALQLSTEEAVCRARQYMFESAALPPGIPVPHLPPHVASWLMDRTERNSTEQRDGPGGASRAPALDEELARELVRRWGAAVEDACARYFSRGAGLQDAMQEVWEVVLQRLAEHQYYDAEQRRHALDLSAEQQGEVVTSVCRDKVSGLVKSRRRFEARHLFSAHDPFLEDVVDGDSSDPLSQLEKAELRDRINAAVATLGNELTELVRAHYLDGETSRQIAKRLGVSESVISRRLAHARAVLTGLLGPAGDRAEE
jgi:RNA polymerase sigma factor (sigma-70 family)